MEAGLERSIARVSEPNRSFVQQAVARRRNNGMRISSMSAWVRAVAKADRFLGGKPFQSATPEDLAGVLSKFRESGIKETTIHAVSVHLRQALKELLDVEKLPRDLIFYS